MKSYSGLRVIRAPESYRADPVEESGWVQCEKGQLSVYTYWTGWVVGCRKIVAVASHDYLSGMRIPDGSVGHWFVQVLLHG